MTATAVREFATGLLATRILNDHGETLWVRTPGADAPAPFVSLSSSEPVAAEIRRDTPSMHRVRLAWGVAPADESARREYRVGADGSLATDLLRTREARDLSHLSATFADLGRTLRVLHSAPPSSATGLNEPRALLRLGTWLVAGEGKSGPAGHLWEQLGSNHRQQLFDLIATGRDDDAVVVHGAPGLGSLVGPDPSGGYHLLAGEDLARANWRYDVGWIVGELAELAWQLRWHPKAWSPLVQSLLEGYGADEGLVRWAALRIAIHAHDIAHYTGCGQDVLDPYIWYVGQLLDSSESS